MSYTKEFDINVPDDELKELALKGMNLFIQGLAKYSENINTGNYTLIPRELEKALDILKAHALIYNENFYTDYKSIYELIQTPISEWGFTFSNTFINEAPLQYIKNIILYDLEEDEPLKKINFLKDSLTNGEDAETYHELTKWFLSLFKELDKGNYPYTRNGLKNSTIYNEDEFIKIFKKIPPSCIKTIKMNMYEPLPDYLAVNNKIHTCPLCGYPMQKIGTEYRCTVPKCEPLKQYLGFNLTESIVKDKPAYILNKKCQFFIKFAGIVEDIFEAKLREVNSELNIISELITYPEKDSADFLVRYNNGEVHAIDVKDFKDPEELAKYLNTNDISKNRNKLKYTHGYILVHDYICTKSYINRFENIYEGTLKIKSFSSYLYKIKKMGEK